MKGNEKTVSFFQLLISVLSYRSIGRFIRIKIAEIKREIWQRSPGLFIKYNRDDARMFRLSSSGFEKGKHRNARKLRRRKNNQILSTNANEILKVS